MAASLFGSGTVLNADSAGTLTPQSFVGTAGQTVFNITSFTYTPGTNSLLVFINGTKQQLDRDFTETSGASFTLVEGVVAGDYVDIIGMPDIASVDSAIVLQRLANSALAADGDGMISVKRSVTGAVGATLHAWIEARDEFNVVAEFASLADGSDQTAKVQLALTALGTSGGIVRIPRGCKFNLKNLTFPKRSNLEYWRDDDTSTPGPGTGLGTSERIYFAANSSGTGAGEGIVNEWKKEAAFNPGHIVNLRKDVAGHDAWLGPGQSRTDPARVYGLIIQDEQTNGLQIGYQAYPSFSNFSGAFFQGSRRVVTTTGVGTNAGGWVATVPVAGDLITGVTSGAKGQVISISATQTILLWVAGKFAVGEKLTNGSQTPNNTLSVVSYAETLFQPLGYDLTRGNWSIGLPAGIARNLFSVGGKIASQQSRTFGQHIDETVTHPGFVVLDSYENATPNGFEIIYDTTPAAASRRLALRKYKDSVNQADLGAARAHTNFRNTVLVSTSAFNVSGIVRNAVGDYTVTFINPFIRADYRTLLTTEDPMDYAYAFAITTTTCRIKVVTTGTTTPRDLTLGVNMLCVGGDI